MSTSNTQLPEEVRNKLDQSNAVLVEQKGPWRNSADMWTFENYTDLEEYGNEVALAEDPLIVLVIDNKDADLVAYPNNKHYWVVYPLTYDSGLTTINIRHLTEYLSILVEEGTSTLEEVNEFEPFGGGFIKIDTYQGYPVIVRDSDIDDSRPDAQSDETTLPETDNLLNTQTATDTKAVSSPKVPLANNPPASQNQGTGSTPPSDKTSPTPVTGEATNTTTTTTTTSTTSSQSQSSVYVYEALSPGFDRYDFNTGKKVYAK